MKKLLLILICVPLIFNSCKKDDDNQPNGNSGTSGSIIGTWDCNSWKWEVIIGYIDPISLSEVSETQILYGLEPEETIEWVFYNNGEHTQKEWSQDTILSRDFWSIYEINENTIILGNGNLPSITITNLTNNTLEVNQVTEMSWVTNDTNRFMSYDKDYWFDRRD